MSLQLVGTAAARQDFTTAQTATVIKSVPGKVGQIVVWNVGVGATIDLYDVTSGTGSGHCWSWATADGKGIFAVQYPMSSGIVINSAGGTPPSFSIAYV